jgi:hypothetical protein
MRQRSIYPVKAANWNFEWDGLLLEADIHRVAAHHHESPLAVGALLLELPHIITTVFNVPHTTDNLAELPYANVL